VTVYDTPGLSGLELWHGITRTAPLYQLRHSKAEYFSALREFLVQLHDGVAATEDDADTLALARAAGFRTVLICGGEAAHPLLEREFRIKPVPFTHRIIHGAFAGREGALAIFDEMRWRRAVALDLGQLQLKVVTPECNYAIERDESLLPFGRDVIAHDLGRSRIRDMLREGLARAGRVEGVVLALPVAIDAAGVARSSTYPGLFGPLEPIFAEVFTTPWVVMNDAVLAARGFTPPAGSKTLVVTLGFGVGGALWSP
jgi:hypothetical protein